MIDLLSILPLYLSMLVPGAQSLLVVRSLRMLRLFRILKLTQYVEERGVLVGALWRSRRKIFVFLSAVLTIVVVFGAITYVVERPAHGFNSISTAMYGAIVTMTTVGFGDIARGTPLGCFITAILILIGCSVIAVPTASTRRSWGHRCVHRPSIRRTIAVAPRAGSPTTRRTPASAAAGAQR